MFGHSRLTVLFVGLVASMCAIAQTTKPVISAITNVASYSPAPIAPGEMVIFFGSGLGPKQLVNLQLDAQGRVANTLSNVQVLFDGTAWNRFTADLCFAEPDRRNGSIRRERQSNDIRIRYGRLQILRKRTDWAPSRSP
jgi:hypothetical protein